MIQALASGGAAARPLALAAAAMVLYLPIATTVLAAVFAVQLLRRAARSGWPPQLTWWGIGVACYGTGTALESTITLAGNTVLLNKLWYVAGALLGAYPLAQGTVHLLLRPCWARWLSRVTLPWVALLAVLVLLSPVHAGLLQARRPGGDVLAWHWLRWCTPVLNGYAALFLVGGAVFSAWRWWGAAEGGARALGNSLIAVGALLPAIGGGLAKTGMVEALYVAELLGLLLIWTGSVACRRGQSARL